MVNLADLMVGNTQRFVPRKHGGSEYKKGITYTEVIQDEVFKVTDNGAFRFYKGTRDSFDLKQDIEHNRENFQLNIPKIPYKYYLMLIDFYRDVNAQYGTEACLLFYWNDDNKEIPADIMELGKNGLIIDGQLIVVCPRQKNSPGLSSFSELGEGTYQTNTGLPPVIDWLESNTSCIMETHSH